MAEFLIIDARQNPDGAIELRRTYTTETPRHGQREQTGDLSPLGAIALGRDGEELARATLRRFAPLERRDGPHRLKVRGELVLPRGAVAVRVLDEEREVAVFELSERPEVALRAHRVRGSARIAIDFSEAGAGAWMAISVFTDGQTPRTVYLGKPLRKYEIDLATVYGKLARIGVLFSTGTRSAAAMSDDVELSRKPAPLEIVEPADGTTITPWDVIDARAGIVRGASEGRELLAETEWHLGKQPLGQGRLVAVGPLPVGKHTLSAKVAASENMAAASASVSITVAEIGKDKPQAAK